MDTKYREKRYGKRTFIIASLVFILVAILTILCGVVAVVKMAHWSKYIIVSVCSIIGLFFGAIGVFMIIMAPSLIDKQQSVRDENTMKGIADVRLCDKCGRALSDDAEFCASCGAKQLNIAGTKTCAKCKHVNKADADFCEKCGEKF